MTAAGPLKIGLVGCGYWGPNLARSLVETGGIELAWLCDTNPAHLEALGARYPMAGRSLRLADLLADKSVQALAISTPTRSHYDLCRQVIEAGKHVLVEKPVTADPDQADRLADLAARYGVVLMVGHVFLYNAGLRKLKELISAGDLGRIHYLAFERTNLGPVRTDVNALWDLASHDVSVMCWLLDSFPESVTATGQVYLNAGVEDVVFATYAFPGGTLAHIHASWLNPRKIRHLTAVGSSRMAVWDDLDLKHPLQLVDKHVQAPALDRMGDSFIDYKTMVVDGGTTLPAVQMAPPLLEECRHFVDCVRHRRTPLTDGVFGARMVGLLAAAQASLAAGGARIPCPGGGEVR